MKLSLSVRIVEAACKTRLNLPFETIVEIAANTGYDAICMRASAGGVETPLDQLQQMRTIVEAAQLKVSMVTADSDVPLNNDDGPNSLRDIGPSLDVAEALGCNLIRICMKKPGDIPFAQTAADQAAERNIRLAHQCHTTSLFEEVEPLLELLRQLDRPNFGIIYEPANLLLCGQAYDLVTLQKLQPYLMNVYVQNHQLDPDGPEALPTFCLGERRFHHLDPWETGGVDFDQVFAGLRGIDYNGYFTIHQAQGIKTAKDATAFASKCAQYVNTQRLPKQ